MLDKRKLTLFIIAAVVIVATIAGIAVLAIGRASTPQATSSTAPATAPIPSGHADETPNSASYESWLAFEPYSQVAREVALEACRWRKLEDAAVKERAYVAAGMSAQLAASFRPVWADVFATESVATAEISCRVNTPPAVNAVDGTEGNYVWRVGVTVIYEGTWVHNATPGAQGAASATWWLTVEQETGEVIAIEQPSPSDVQIRIEE